jgi:DNA repair protein RadC
MHTLYVRSGSHYRVARPVEVLDVAATYKAREFERDRVSMDSPPVAKAFLIDQLQHNEEEHFCVLFLDTRMRLIAFDKMFRGTVDGSSVHPREVVKAALAHNAAAVIFAHNHPSGVASPSTADELITARLRDALSLVDVRVLDHFIIGDRCYSFAEAGLL